MTYLKYFEIPNIRYVQIDTKNEHVSSIQLTINKGSQKVTLTLLFMVNGHPLKSRTQVRNCNYCEIRDIEHYGINR